MIHLEGRGVLREENVGLYWLNKAATQKHRKAIIRHAVVRAGIRLRATRSEQMLRDMDDDPEAPESNDS